MVRFLMLARQLSHQLILPLCGVVSHAKLYNKKLS
jgi:hypothetical protein